MNPFESMIICVLKKVETLRLGLAIWSIRPYFPYCDIYANGGIVKAFTFSCDEDYLKKVQEAGKKK